LIGLIENVMLAYDNALYSGLQILKKYFIRKDKIDKKIKSELTKNSKNKQENAITPISMDPESIKH
jgi:hypothetical protein